MRLLPGSETVPGLLTCLTILSLLPTQVRAQGSSQLLTTESVWLVDAIHAIPGPATDGTYRSARTHFDLLLSLQPPGIPSSRLVARWQQAAGLPSTTLEQAPLHELSGLHGPELSQVSELYVSMDLPTVDAGIVIGKHDANGIFGHIEPAGAFMHSSFGAPPTLPMPAFPDPGFGMAVTVRVGPRSMIRAGVYDGDPLGRRLIPSGTGRVFTVMELEHGVSAPGGALTLTGGAWNINPSRDLHPGETVPEHAHGCAGTHLSALWSACGDAGSLSAFLQAGWSPYDCSVTAGYAGGGVIWVNGGAGLIQGAGTGIGDHFLGRLAPQTERETVIEGMIRLRLQDRVLLQPGLQWVRWTGEMEGRFLTVGFRLECHLR